MPEDVLVLLEIVGLRPVMVEGLGWGALLLPAYGLVLLDADMALADPEGTATSVLGAAASELRQE